MLEAVSTLVFILFSILLYYLYREIQRQHKRPKRSHYTSPESLQSKITRKPKRQRCQHTPETLALKTKVERNLQSSPAPTNWGKSQPDQLTPLKNKAYRMSPTDPTAPDRLAAWVREQYPGKSDKWVWEKVISDMERDRR
jgi:hypothetical protein